MSQISFSDLVNGTVPDASDFNDRFNALKNRINNGMEADNIATGAITTAKIVANAVDASKLDETDDYTWTGAHDFSGATLTGAAQVNGMIGSYKNLIAAYASAATVDVDVDHLIVWDSGNRAKLLSSVNLTANIASSGANGLDTGAEASGTWYYIWVIYNGTTASALLSTSATSPTMPSGYTYKALVSAVRNNGSSNFVSFKQTGRKYIYTNGQAAFDGSAGSGWDSVDITSYVPSSLSNYVWGTIQGDTSDMLYMTNDSSVSSTATSSASNRIVPAAVASFRASYVWQHSIQTANTLYVGMSGNGRLYIDGFEINMLG